MRKLLILLLFASPLFAQQTTSSTGTINAAGATCGTTNACISLFMVPNVSSVSVTVSGTYTGTLQFEQSGDNGTTFSAASPASTSTTGLFTFTIQAQTNFRVRASAFASGSATVFINTSTAAGGGTVTTVTGTAPIASSGGNTPALSCPTCNITSAVNKSTTFVADQGTACTNGELALSAGWQSTGSATVTGAKGNGQTCEWVITTGTTTAANPTVTDTLTNVLPNATTVCEMIITGGNRTAAASDSFDQTTLSATAPVFTFQGTPTAAGKTYNVVRRCGP